jgi:hypothetical protein
MTGFSKGRQEAQKITYRLADEGLLFWRATPGGSEFVAKSGDIYVPANETAVKDLFMLCLVTWDRSREFSTGSVTFTPVVALPLVDKHMDYRAYMGYPVANESEV